MLHQIKELLKDVQVGQAVQAAATRAEAVALLASEGIKRGYQTTTDGVGKALSELMPSRSRELSEDELLFVSGGRPADSAPKLCHTDSCGGGHAGCC